MRRALLVLAAVIVVAGTLISGCLTKTENRAPTAVFSASSNAVNAGQQVIFDAGNSTDRDGKIIRYNWDFGDSAQDMGVSVIHGYSSGGNYTVTLTVTDNEGKKDRANMTVHVNEYPKARLDCSAREAKVLAPVAFSAKTRPTRMAGWCPAFGISATASTPPGCMSATHSRTSGRSP